MSDDLIGEKLDLQEENLSKKVAKGTFWLFSLRFGDQFLSFIKTIILAHILSPKDFGLFAIAFIAISVVNSFSQTGFQEALIQKKNSIESYLNTAWIIQIARGLLLMIILLIGAPLVAHLFNVPQVSLVLQVIAVAILIQAFTNIGIIYFKKNIELSKYFTYQLIGIIVDFVVALAFAFIFRNVWALVAGFIAESIVFLVISYIVHDYRPKFNFDFTKARELFHFGKWVFGSSILGFILSQGDSIFVGKLLGIIPLGFYQISSKISSVTGAEVISGAVYPAYSKLQHDPKRMGQAYLKILKILFFVLAPIAGGIVALAGEFTVLFLGKQWLPSVPSMQILAISGTIWGVAVIGVPIFSAIGQPKVETKFNLIKFVVLFTFLYPFIKVWGIFGASLAVLLSVIVYTSATASSIISIVKCGWPDFLKTIAIPFFNSALMVLAVLTLSLFVKTNYIGMFFLIFVGVASYVASVFFCDLFLNYKIIKTLKESWHMLVN